MFICNGFYFHLVFKIGSSWNLHQIIISENACGMYDSMSTGRMPRSHGKVFVTSAPWLHTYLMDSLHIWHKYNKILGGNVSCNISRYIWGHGSFKGWGEGGVAEGGFAMSCINSRTKGQRSTSHNRSYLKFWLSSATGFHSYFWSLDLLVIQAF